MANLMQKISPIQLNAKNIADCTGLVGDHISSGKVVAMVAGKLQAK